MVVVVLGGAVAAECPLIRLLLDSKLFGLGDNKSG